MVVGKALHPLSSTCCSTWWRCGNEGKYFIYSVSYRDVVQMIDLFIINIHSIFLLNVPLKLGIV